MIDGACRHDDHNHTSGQILLHGLPRCWAPVNSFCAKLSIAREVKPLIHWLLGFRRRASALILWLSAARRRVRISQAGWASPPPPRGVASEASWRGPPVRIRFASIRPSTAPLRCAGQDDPTRLSLLRKANRPPPFQEEVDRFSSIAQGYMRLPYGWGGVHAWPRWPALAVVHVRQRTAIRVLKASISASRISISF